MAVVHGSVCQFRGSHGRRARQSASGHVCENHERKPKRTVCGATAVQRFSPVRNCAPGISSLVTAGEFIPGDGEVIEGVASVDESAITGESAPVIRESGGDRSAVTGGTRVLSDEIKVRITSNPGETFLDRMIKLVEGASRQKTPNEIALNILLAGLTIIFLLAVVTLQPFAIYSGAPQSMFVLVSLLVCLIPTTIGGLLSAIGIAGMDRLIQRNVIAMSGRAVEASGDVDVLLLDKTGTITLGNRAATAFLSCSGLEEDYLADAAQLSSLADETPEGRSIVVLAKERYKLRGRDLSSHGTNFIPFSAQTRMSGVDIDGREIRKGRRKRLRDHQPNAVTAIPPRCRLAVERDLQCRRHATAGGGEPPRAGGDCPHRYRQRRNEGALRPSSRHGHSHDDDHRRQPADGRGHCARSRRR